MGSDTETYNGRSKQENDNYLANEAQFAYMNSTYTQEGDNQSADKLHTPFATLAFGGYGGDGGAIAERNAKAKTLALVYNNRANEIRQRLLYTGRDALTVAGSQDKQAGVNPGPSVPPPNLLGGVAKNG